MRLDPSEIRSLEEAELQRGEMGIGVETLSLHFFDDVFVKSFSIKRGMLIGQHAHTYDHGHLVASGKIDDGIAYIKETMKMDPTFAWTHSHVSFLYRMKGDHASSVDERARADELLDMPEAAKRLRESFAAGGWTAYLRELVSQDWGSLGSSGTRRASLVAELGDKEKAIALLNDAATRGDTWLFSIKYDPAFDSLRGDPRFQAVLKKFDPPK